jgi:Protein of unknown function (DUF4019)
VSRAGEAAARPMGSLRLHGAWVLLVAACWLALAARGALAQDPRASAAQAAARAWLALTDRGDADASWAAAGKKFRTALDAAGWAKALAQARTPLGATIERAALSTKFETKFPNGEQGEYALILFETSFAKKTRARESVTLERESDGVWRVVGYFIR